MATPTNLPASFVSGAILTADQMNNLRGAFRVLQVIRDTDTASPSTTSTSFTDVSGVSVTISPQSTTSNILVIASFLGVVVNSSTGQNQGSYSITDSANTALSGAQSQIIGTVNYTHSAGYFYAPVTMIGFVSPNSIAAQTYKLRFKSNFANTTTYVAGGDNTTQLYAIELSA